MKNSSLLDIDTRRRMWGTYSFMHNKRRFSFQNYCAMQIRLYNSPQKYVIHDVNGHLISAQIR